MNTFYSNCAKLELLEQVLGLEKEKKIVFFKLKLKQSTPEITFPQLHHPGIKKSSEYFKSEVS